MIYILILTLWGGEGNFPTVPAITTVELSSPQACSNAGQQWAADIRKAKVQPRIMWLCVPK